MYTIKITYQTGSSFGITVNDNILGICWKDIDKAKSALRKIKRHNTFYNNKNSYSYKKNKEFDNHDEYIIMFENDNGVEVQTSAFWRGWFEKLICAEIIFENDNDINDLKIEF